MRRSHAGDDIFYGTNREVLLPDWAVQTVGYAYDAVLTNGVGGGRFGSDSVSCHGERLR